MSISVKRVGGVAIAALMLTTTPSFAADVVILDSSVGDLFSGMILPEADQVAIPSGESVTMIMASGETRTVIGPYEGPIGDAASSAEGEGLMLASRGSETKVLGAVRAPKWEVTD